MNAVFAMLKVSNLRAVTVKISVSLGESHDHRNFLPQAIKGVSGLFAFRVRIRPICLCPYTNGLMAKLSSVSEMNTSN